MGVLVVGEDKCTATLSHRSLHGKWSACSSRWKKREDAERAERGGGGGGEGLSLAPASPDCNLQAHPATTPFFYLSTTLYKNSLVEI